MKGISSTTTTNKTAQRKLTKGERTAQRILDVAEAVFAEKGFDGSSLREIAQLVDIKEPGLYRHFPNKETLYKKVLERCLEPIVELLQTMADSHEQIQGQGLLTIEVIEQVMDMLAAHPHISFLFQQAVMAGPQAQTETNLWLNTLLEQGKGIISTISYPLDNNSEELAVLRLVALFNLCAGYFSSASIIRSFLGKEPSDTELLKKQKALLVEIGNAWLKG
ncbi:MAG: TetR/AcrR family transcriptional regulator [Pseudomonadales bacterium]|nr:TetR/AcrR family transcriptional regulator [Pseudomonadales bacterium]